MLLAEPSIIFIADSIEDAFKSGILRVAISLIFSLEIFPTFVLFGFALAVSSPIAFLIKTAAGGVFKTKSNDLSA